MKDLRILFMGTPEFAVGILKTLVNEGKNIVGVITSPDKPAGRGRKLHQSAIKKYALEHELNVLQPKNLKSKDFLNELEELDANLQIVVAFRMLPEVVWSMPEYGTFNLHASLLPQYRGAAPINWAIINGEAVTGVTTFFIDEKIDTGAIISKKEINVDKNETAGSLHDKLMILGSELVLETVQLIEDRQAASTEQVHIDNLNKAPKLNAENTKIDWNRSVEEIDRLIRGLNPYPVAWTNLINDDQSIKVKIYRSDSVIEEHSNGSGKVFTTKKELKVSALNGYIIVKEIQLPGKRKMDVASLLNGYNFKKNAIMM